MSSERRSSHIESARSMAVSSSRLRRAAHRVRRVMANFMGVGFPLPVSVKPMGGQFLSPGGLRGRSGGQSSAIARTKDSNIAADATVFNSDSVTYDALIVGGGVTELDPKSAMMLQEAYRHHKTIGAWGSGVALLAECGIDSESAGIVTAEKIAKQFTKALINGVGWHRHWER